MSVISIQLEDIADYPHGDVVPAFARLFAHSDFRTSEGIFVAKGSPDGDAGFYQEFTASLVGTKIRIAAGTAYSTTDALVNPSVGYSLVIYDANGSEIKRVFSNVHIPPVSPTTWGAIEIFSKGKQQRYPSTYLDSNSIIALLSQYQSNVLAVDDTYGPGWNGNLAVAGKNAIYDAVEILRAAKQDTLVAGTNIKTINGVSPLGPGNIAVSGGVETFVSTPTHLGDLITTANANPSVKYDAIVDASVPVTAVETIPANVYFESKNGGVFVKSFTGALHFAGIGLSNPMSQTPIFSGFGVGDVTWTGSTYPARLSTSLWDNVALSSKINRATNAMVGKQCTLVAYPGDIAGQVILKAGHSLHLTRGTYTDTFVGEEVARFSLEDNTKVYGDGIGQTIYNCSTLIKNARIITVSGLITGFGPNENIEVSDIYFHTDLSTTNVDTGGACVLLGNCINGHVRRCYFKNTCAYGVYFGASPAGGYYASNCSVTDCIFDGVRGQVTGSVNGQNILVSRNLFTNIQIDPGMSFITVVDFEPNGSADRITNIQITDNFFDGRGAQQFWNAIVVQPGGNTAGCDFGLISNNYIRGDIIKLSNAISLTGCANYLVSDNYIYGCTQSAIGITNSSKIFLKDNILRSCGASGIPAVRLTYVSDSWVEGTIGSEVIGTDPTPDRCVVEAVGTCTVTTSGTGVTRTVGSEYFFPHWVGKTVTITGVDYTVLSVTDDAHLILTASAGVQVGATLTTKFNNNVYRDNTFVTYTLVNNSRVISAADRDISAVTSPVQLTANQNDYDPQILSRILRMSSDASRDITGITTGSYPYYTQQQGGQKHTLVNVGSFDIVLKHQNAGSSATNRFLCSTGADITLSANQRVELVYDSTIQRWRVYPSGQAEALIVPCSNQTTAIAAAATGVLTFRMPYGFILQAVRASLKTAASSGTFTVDINKNGTSILSTKLTLDATEKTSVTAAVPAVISDHILGDDVEITVDIDNAAAGDALGLMITLIGIKG